MGNCHIYTNAVEGEGVYEPQGNHRTFMVVFPSLWH